MKKDKNNQQGTVLPFDRYRHNAGKENDASEKSVHQLLDHMRRMRDAVPVNYQLQEELRQKLIKDSKPATDPSDKKRSNNLPQHRLAPKVVWAAAAIILLVIVIIAWQGTKPAALYPVGGPRETARFWNADPGVSFSVSPSSGEILVARHGQLLLVEEEGGRYQVLDLPSTWLYHSPSFSPDGSRVALVRNRKDGRQQVLIVPLKELKSESKTLNELKIIAESIDDVKYTGLTWSPDGGKLAYTKTNKNSNATVWTATEDEQPREIVQGMNPTWSPDGSSLIVQRSISEQPDKLYLVELATGNEEFLGQGEQPNWGLNGYLAFVSTHQQEKILTFMPDGSPQFTIHQRVGEIRSVFAGENGKDMLSELRQGRNWLSSSNLVASPLDANAEKEMEWLRSLEIQGIREPRTLMLDTVNGSNNPVLNNSSLYYLRQDDIYAAVMQVHLKERLFSRGENYNE
ncbi:MAG: hypothetical protein FH758_00200 [Firmicutes bacterium]|nr:hypothetical protein [Bacillota bacterium]